MKRLIARGLRLRHASGGEIPDYAPKPGSTLPVRDWVQPPAEPSVARLVCAAPFMAGAVICLAVVEGLLGAAEEHFRECLRAEDHGGSYDADG